MRTIKFRGCEWNADNELLPFVYGKLCDVDVIRTIKGIDKVVHYKTVGQFTGLHDKNGKEIYEGDKLRDDYYDEDTVIEDYAVVVWDGKLCQWAIDNSFAQDGSSYTNLVEYFGRENLEIIGNVFENADLVKL